MYGQVMQQYVNYMCNHYQEQCEIVFDGYGNGHSIKDQEHDRRAAGQDLCPDVAVEENMPAYKNRNAFFTNNMSEKLFIEIISQQLQKCHYIVHQAQNDADTLVVKTALTIASRDIPVTVVPDDTDILAMLVHHITPTMADIYLLSDMPARGTAQVHVTPVHSVRYAIGDKAVQQLLVVHALSGCDTTSALFGRGKAIIYKKILQSSNILSLTDKPDHLAHRVKKSRTLVLGCWR